MTCPRCGEPTCNVIDEFITDSGDRYHRREEYLVTVFACGHQETMLAKEVTP
jgi:transcriptional regulator NrdR family protein